MADDMIMRSFYLRPHEDGELRQLAHELKVTKNDLIRSAIAAKLNEWREANSDDGLQKDLELGRRVRESVLRVQPAGPPAAKTETVAGGGRGHRATLPRS